MRPLSVLPLSSSWLSVSSSFCCVVEKGWAKNVRNISHSHLQNFSATSSIFAIYTLQKRYLWYCGSDTEKIFQIYQKYFTCLLHTTTVSFFFSFFWLIFRTTITFSLPFNILTQRNIKCIHYQVHFFFKNSFFVTIAKYLLSFFLSCLYFHLPSVFSLSHFQ